MGGGGGGEGRKRWEWRRREAWMMDGLDNSIKDLLNLLRCGIPD